MAISDSKRFPSLARWQIPLFGAAVILFFLPVVPALAPQNSLAETEANLNVLPVSALETSQAPLIQNNSFLATGSLIAAKPDITVIETIQVVATGYSSSVWETDNTPYITASGTTTRDGVVASNLLPFGTKIRVPEYFGSKIFVVEDRMNSRINDFQVDVWFPSHWQAENFGVKYTYIETVR
jgi:3D (Asp-Asp-Asp) domain-containing protein